MENTNHTLVDSQLLIHFVPQSPCIWKFLWLALDISSRNNPSQSSCKEFTVQQEESCTPSCSSTSQNCHQASTIDESLAWANALCVVSSQCLCSILTKWNCLSLQVDPKAVNSQQIQDNDMVRLLQEGVFYPMCNCHQGGYGRAIYSLI